LQRLGHDALDTVRRQQWRAADADDKKAIKGTRFALQKNPWNLTDVEQGKLTDVQRTNRPLYRAYLLLPPSRPHHQEIHRGDQLVCVLSHA
jgi:transposase